MTTQSLLEGSRADGSNTTGAHAAPHAGARTNLAASPLRSVASRFAALARPATLLAALPVAGALAVGLLGLPRFAPHAAPRASTPYRDRIAVASENGVATRVGMEALRSGANAVDAAISVALALGVVQPESSGIGGGGFALVWDAESRKVTALDFREMAPAGVEAKALDD